MDPELRCELGRCLLAFRRGRLARLKDPAVAGPWSNLSTGIPVTPPHGSGYDRDGRGSVGARPRRRRPNPAWSPDGRLIAFGRGAHWPSSQPLGIWTIRPSGRGLHRILARGGDPAFAPDGRWLTFVWFRDEQQEVYKAHADGSGIVQLTHTDEIIEDEPSWQRAP